MPDSELRYIAQNRDGAHRAPARDEEEYIAGELKRLADVLDAWTDTHDEHPEWLWKAEDGEPSQNSAFYNTGRKFKNRVFIARAYDWNDDDEYGPTNVNFYHYASGCDITWYKWFGRGPYLHGTKTIHIIENRLLGPIVDECIASVAETARNEY